MRPPFAKRALDSLNRERIYPGTLFVAIGGHAWGQAKDWTKSDNYRSHVVIPPGAHASEFDWRLFGQWWEMAHVICTAIDDADEPAVYLIAAGVRLVLASTYNTDDTMTYWPERIAT